ncbi:lectin-like protein [Thalassolituus sp. LLYu03]|uniref:lectin-like protein n=1 Tax=Thalassolituus sp. LLYu03 TaxID=3421656 RepID=UPI003D2BA405
MKNNYKKTALTLTLMLSTSLSFAASIADKTSIWFDDGATGGLTAAQVVSINSDTVTFWNSGEPNDSSSEDCATQTNTGVWNDIGCEQTRRVACFNGTVWSLTAGTVAMGADNNASGTISNAQTACTNISSQFAAPTTLEQRNALTTLISNAGITNGVFINAQDMVSEGVWVINKGATNLAPFWNGGEPNNSGGSENCAESTSGSIWNDLSCSATRAVACANSTFTSWTVVNSPVAFTSVDELNAICRNATSGASQFAAPRTSAEQSALNSAISGAGLSSVWINATDMDLEGYWKLNHGLFNWASGQPSSAVGICSTVRQSDGKWISADCDSRAKILCSNNSTWVIRNATHQFSNQALDACSRPDSDTGSNAYVGYSLAAPRSEQERSLVTRLIQAQGTGTVAWLNLKLITDTGEWLWNEGYEEPDTRGGDPVGGVWYDLINEDDSNKAYSSWQRYSDGVTIYFEEAAKANGAVKAYFSPGEPNDSGDCIQLYSSNARWDDTPCTNSQRVACFNGYNWAISPGSIALEASNNANNENQLVAAANAQCALIADSNGATGNYRFAAPTSYAQTQDLKTIAAYAGAGNVWINMNDRRYEKTFVLNLNVDVLAPFWNTGEPNNAGSGEDCATQQTASGLWNDIDCSRSERVACFDPYTGNNGTWSITPAAHTYSTTQAMSEICAAAFGGHFNFFAPVTLSQKTDLVAAMNAASVTEAYINANDQQSEGIWLLNKEVNNWEVGQPSAVSSELCVSASASTSRWRARDCSQSLPVACTTGGRWYFTDSNVSLTDFANGQNACDTLGTGYLFVAPRSQDESLLLQYFALIEGVGGDFWINGNRLNDFAVWEWNRRSTTTPIWSATEPDGASQENCAVLQNDDEGSWADKNCSSATTYRYLCRNGSNWALSLTSDALDDFSTATNACAALGAGWVFAAPETYNENLQARALLNTEGVAAVWINATDAMREGVWVTNAAAIAQYPNWASGQPDNGGVLAAAETSVVKGEDCVVQADDGFWSDISCTSSVDYPWACTDGYTWKVTQAQGRIQNLADGHKQCFTEYGTGYVFAAPLTQNDAIQIDFARLLAQKERGTAITRVWLNMTDGGNEDHVTAVTTGTSFRKNLPFTNWLSPAYPGEEPVNLCVYKSTVSSGQNNPWRTASCTSAAAHYACFDGSSWNVATSKGALVNGSLQVVPQVGEDYWSYERGNRMCKDQFGPQFYFSAPVTAAEEQALDTAIRAASAQVKNTWLNYYYVSEITSANNRWFADRLKLGVWQKPVFDNYNNSDCALLDTSGNWTDVPCNSGYAYACFNGSWTITGLSGKWDDGFAACQEQNNSLFAVPRTPDELSELIAVMAGQPVWINMSDTALESQWIANRLRYAWWATGEPSNISNRDCAQIATDGQWHAARCSTEMAAFACRQVTGSNIEWFVTSSTGIWSQGFSACALEFPGSEFFTPHGYGSRSATMDQALLSSVVASAGKAAWLNLSDQEVEGNWRPYQVYADWAVDSLLDQTNDCAYFDRVTPGSGTWYADSCKYTAGSAVSRGYACTNGYEWRIVNVTPTTNMRWSEGFTACDSLDTADENWSFAAPTDAVQNAKLKLAMELGGLSQVWINAQDRVEEGEWTVNGAETNFPVVADTSATALVVAEQTPGVVLSAALADDEEVGIASAIWTLVSDSRFSNVADSDVVVSNNQLVTGALGTGTVTAQYNAPTLLQTDALLTFKLTVTDIPPGTATAVSADYFVTVRIKAPILAHYDFSDAAAPEKDISGNGHDAINTVANPLPAVASGSLSLTPTDVMIVPGLTADPSNGLDIPATAYTIAFRMSIEVAGTGYWRGILQKGDGEMDRQPAMFLFPGEESLHSTNSTTLEANRSANQSNIPFQQWLNIIYSKRTDGFDVYIDEALVASYDFVGETSVGNTGSFYVGHVPGSAESFTGLIDDIQIFNRVLTATERGQVLPTPPLGQVQFASAGSVADEFATAPGNTVTVSLERTRGSKAPLTVYVDLDTANSTAELGEQADMVTATDTADLAFGAAYASGTGFPVTWAADTRGIQTFTLTLDNADDNIREGTETARLKIANASGATTGSPANYVLRLTDLTPNPYGNFSIEGPDPQIVLENNAATQQICIKRESGATGLVTVNYEISGSAVAGADVSTGDYQFLATGLQPVGLSDSVQFLDGDSTDKCFDIQVFDNPSIGDADMTLQITITGLNYDAATLDPILTAQNQAQITIRDYAPGEFRFVSGSATCKEPNTDASVPDELRATGSEECEAIVERINTSLYAPAGILNVVKTAQTPNDAPTTDAGFTAQLVFPELTPGSSIADKLQVVTFTVINDHEQENDEVLTFQIQPTTGDGLDETITQNTLALTITDVTTPALLTSSITGAPATGLLEVDEGGAVTINVVRTQNSNTAFSADYELSSTLLSGYVLSDILSLSIDGASASATGNMAFTRNGDDDRSLVVQTVNTVEPMDNRVVTLRMDNASPDRVVGIGDIANANKDTQNFSEVSFRIKNTRDFLSDIFASASATRVTSQGNTALNATTYTSVEHITRDIQPVHGYVALNASFNAYQGIYDIQDTALLYSVTFYQAGSVNATVNSQSLSALLRKDDAPEQSVNATGSIALDPASGAAFNPRLLMPYVTDGNSSDVEMKVRFVGNVTGDVVEQTYRFHPTEVWRRIEYNDNNECAYISGATDIEWDYGIGNSCGPVAVNNYTFTFNAFTKQIESRSQPGMCLAVPSNSNSANFRIEACDSNNNLQQFSMSGDRISVVGAPDYVMCGAIGGNLFLRADSGLSCSYRSWQWYSN